MILRILPGTSGTSADSESASSCHSLPSPVPLATLLPQQLRKIMRTLDKVSRNQRRLCKKVQMNSRRIQQNSVVSVVKRPPRRAALRPPRTHCELPSAEPNRAASSMVPGGNGQTAIVPVRNGQALFFTPAPPVPRFRGQYQGKHPVKFLEELETYFRKINIPDELKLGTVLSEALTETAQDWSAIFRDSWDVYEDFRKDFLQTFWSEEEQMKLRQTINNHRWSAKSNRSMEAHFAHYVSLARLLTDPIPENILVANLIKHFPTNIQALWSLTTEKTTTAAAAFLRLQEGIIVGSQTQLEPKRASGAHNQVTPRPTAMSLGNGRRSC